MSKKQEDIGLRPQLLHAMRGDQSHITFDEALKDFPVAQAGEKPAGAPHSAWQLLEHMRIAQNDILEFSRDPNYKSPEWPEGYWHREVAPVDEKAWERSVTAFRKDRDAMDKLIGGEEHDLYAKIEGGAGQTLLREALVLAAHNSYHLGQLMFLRRILEAKK